MKYNRAYRWIIIIELLVLLLAFTIRLAYFNGLRQLYPDFLVNQPFCGLDANSYHEIYAKGLLKGDWPGDEPFFHMILYPYYLAGVYALVGISLRVVVVTHILLEVLTCAGLYGIGRLAFNRPAGLVASFFFAIYAPGIFFNPCYAQVALSVPLFAVTLFLLLKAQQTRRLGYLIVAGFTTGLAALSRPTFFQLVPIIGLWWLVNRLPWRRVILQAVIYGTIIFIVTLPASLHNYRTAGHFSPAPVSGWEIFFLGNNPYAEGLGWVDYVLYNHFDVAGEQYAVDVRTRANQTGSAVYRQEAFNYIAANPAGWLNLLWRKTYLLVGESDDRLISPYFVHNLQTVPFMRYLPLGWRAVFIAALLGILLVKHKHKFLLVLLLVALIGFTTMFHIQYRFRLLLAPPVVLYAAALIAQAPWLNRWRFTAALAVLAGLTPWLPSLGWLLGLFLLFALWPPVWSRQWRQVGWATIAIWGYTVAALLVGQIYAFTHQSSQTQALFLSPAVSGPLALGQSFVVHCAGFNRVSLNLGLPGHVERGPAMFHLRVAPNSPNDIYSAPLDTSDAQDRAWYDVTFPAQANSAGQAYFLFIDAPQTAPAQAVALRGTYDQPFDRYREGTAYVGRPDVWQEIPGDLAFSAHCDENLLAMVNQTWAQWLGRAWMLGWALLASHTGLLIWAILKLWKLPDSPKSIS